MEVDVPAVPVASTTSIGKGKGKEGDSLGFDSLPWVEKYRPVLLDDVVAHKDIISTIEQFIAKSRVPHLLFYGPPGTGKTSTILAVARKIYGDASALRNNVLELNASDDRGIDVVREQIKNFASTKMTAQGAAGFKLIILDEADMMTNTAQSALRRVIEQYTKNVRFCIICNYVNKINPAVQSRCTRFRFGPLPILEVGKRIDHVIAEEKVNITDDGKQALLKLSRGDMRRALNVLQACHAAYELTDEAAIFNCTGNPQPADIDEIMRSMMNDSFETSYHHISTLKAEKGLALQDIITGVYDYVATLVCSAQTRVYLLDQLAQVEHRLSTGGSEKLQLTALLGATKISIVFTVAFALILAAGLFRALTPRSRSSVLIKPIIFAGIRVATYAIRAYMADGHYSTGLFIANQILLLCGFVLLCSTCLELLGFHMIRTWVPTGGRKLLLHYFHQTLELALLAAIVLGIYAGSAMGSLGDDASQSQINTLKACRRVLDANVVICIIITILIIILSFSTYLKQSPRPSFYVTLYLAFTTVMLTIGSIYKLVTYIHPPSLVHVGSKVGFYCLSALPEVIATAFLFSINLNDAFHILEGQQKRKDNKLMRKGAYQGPGYTSEGESMRGGLMGEYGGKSV
ncbi:replication factor C subunit 3 [Pseudohyphozyma bogoriensis]|nr:replication factor C subunit 3 [Pseudohyphozyma bogoriensis]